MRENTKYQALYATRFMGEFVFYSLLAIYLKDSGFSGSKIGALLSFSPFILALSQPVWSMIDHGKTRKILIITAAALIIALEFSIVYAKTFSILVVVMVLYSIIRAPIAPSLDAMTTIYCVENNTEYAVFRYMGSVGFIIALLGGSFLYGKVDFVYLVIISAVFFTVFIVFSLTVKPLDLDKAKREKPNLKLLFTNRDFIVFLIAEILCFGTLQLNNGFDILYIQYRGLKTSLYGITTLIRVGSEVITLLFLRRLKPNQYKLILTLMPVFVIAQSLIYFLNAPVFTIFLVMVFAGTASGIIIFLTNKYIAMIVRPINITAATYITCIAQNLASATFLVLGGIIMDKLGINYIYFVTGIIFVAAAVFVALFVRKNPPIKT
ncbi:MAG TPA: MFS transporter [Clostridia bacterium]|nr:MFS transporter [Clostridia bacterium]